MWSIAYLPFVPLLASAILLVNTFSFFHVLFSFFLFRFFVGFCPVRFQTIDYTNMQTMRCGDIGYLTSNRHYSCQLMLCLSVSGLRKGKASRRGQVSVGKGGEKLCEWERIDVSWWVMNEWENEWSSIGLGCGLRQRVWDKCSPKVKILGTERPVLSRWRRTLLFRCFFLQLQPSITWCFLCKGQIGFCLLFS